MKWKYIHNHIFRRTFCPCFVAIDTLYDIQKVSTSDECCWLSIQLKYMWSQNCTNFLFHVLQISNIVYLMFVLFQCLKKYWPFSVLLLSYDDLHCTSTAISVMRYWFAGGEMRIACSRQFQQWGGGFQGRIQDFKLGEAHLKKLRRAEGGATIFGVFRVKNHDFTPKKSYFFQF